MHPSRGGSACPFGGCARREQARFLSWNANALAHRDPAIRRRKRSLLAQLLRDVDFAVIQETHADYEGICVHFPELRDKFAIFASPCPTLGAGGVLTLIAKRIADAASAPCVTSFSPGRVLRVRIVVEGITNVIWNVHNHDLSHGELACIQGALRADIAEARQSQGRMCAIVGGDFNFAAHACPAIRPGELDGPRGVDRGSRPGQRELSGALCDMVEVTAAAYTHFDLKNNIFTAIDRFSLRWNHGS